MRPEDFAVDLELGRVFELPEIARAEGRAVVAGFTLEAGPAALAVPEVAAVEVAADPSGSQGAFQIGVAVAGSAEVEAAQYTHSGVVGVALAFDSRGGGEAVVGVVVAFAVLEECAEGGLGVGQFTSNGESGEEVVAIDADVRAGVVAQTTNGPRESVTFMFCLNKGISDSEWEKELHESMARKSEMTLPLFNSSSSKIEIGLRCVSTSG
jgi:hypothetical protein